jgi:hypothetical protein
MQPKKELTLEDLIEIARADLAKFVGVVIPEYTKRNPKKALAKQEEFTKKTEVKQKTLDDLLAMQQKQIDVVTAQRQKIEQERLDLEAARQAEIDNAREEGRKQALAEMAKTKKVKDEEPVA